MFQANGGVRIECCGKFERRTCCELEVMDDRVRTDGVEDISERLGGK